MGKAAGLAETILDLFHEQLPGGVTLLPGSGGVFEILLDDEVIFSKKAASRFPRATEVEDALEERLTRAPAAE